jgi:DNA-binding transcriptional MerR regulator
VTTPRPRSRAAATASAPAAPETLLKIGDVASASGASVDTLRFYEKRGLLTPARRRPSGYREYSPDAVRLVRFIRRAQALGFTLAEVEDLVQMRERAWVGDGPQQLRKAADAKVTDIDRRVRELRALRGALAKLITACDVACGVEAGDSACDAGGDCCSPAGGVLDCPLVEALEDESPHAPAPGRRRGQHKRTPARVSPTPTRRKR